MWNELIVAGGFVGTQGIILGWLNSRMNKIESDRKKELYRPDGQPNYVFRDDCKTIQKNFCSKVDEVKELLTIMDEKRAKAKDDYYNGLLQIEKRLVGIEAKLP